MPKTFGIQPKKRKELTKKIGGSRSKTLRLKGAFGTSF
jgi:hypothetical protein